MTAWIRMISDTEASPRLLEVLESARAPSGDIGNVMRVHSLRPSTMAGHVALYNAVLHDNDNTLPGWLQETIASYVSLLNDCSYSFTNHWANAVHLIGDLQRSGRIEAALRADSPQRVFSGRELAMFNYARSLTKDPGGVTREHVAEMAQFGASDDDILEVNQIVCYFNFVNRLLNGLGVKLEGDVVGYYVSPEAAEYNRDRQDHRDGCQNEVPIDA